MRSARCERSRESVSLRLDGMLSVFEGALLDRHLRRCASCRAFAAATAAQTDLLRTAPLEQPQRPIEAPRVRHRAVRRAATGTIGAVLAAAAAALVLISSGSRDRAGLPPRVAVGTAAPVLMVVAAQPSPDSPIEVPRLKMSPASVADGPVHGYFSQPV